MRNYLNQGYTRAQSHQTSWLCSTVGQQLSPFGLVVWVRSTVGGDVGLNDQGLVLLLGVCVLFASLPFLAFVVVARGGERDSGTAEGS